jgi:hypothetical protein
MKKYLFSAILFMISISFFANAQDEIVIKGSKKLTKEYTPQQVIDSLNKRFPDAKSVEVFQTKADAVNKGWTVTEEDNLSGDADYYTISFKNEGMKYYGLYDKEGNLLQSKVEEKVDQLPQAVVNSIRAISDKYPGYKVVSKTYYKNQNLTKSKEYYEVIAKKGNETKRLYYAPDGLLIKSKG